MCTHTICSSWEKEKDLIFNQPPALPPPRRPRSLFANFCWLINGVTWDEILKDQIGLPIKPDRPLQRCLCPPQLPCLSQTWPRTWALDNHAFVQFSISVCHLQIRLFNYLQNPHNASLFQSHLSPSASLVVPGLLDWAVSNKARKCSSPILFT